MEITTDQVKQLRERTGISIMQCKRALEEASGDFDKAIVILQKKSGSVAEKKADRELGAGAVQAYVHVTRDVGALVVLSCETDFVAKNDEFVQLAYDIAMHIAATNPAFIRPEDVTEADMRAAREVFEKEVADKPADMREKILSGKLDAYFADKVLMKQPFVKQPELAIQDLIASAVQKFGERVEVTSFTRYSIR